MSFDNRLKVDRGIKNKTGTEIVVCQWIKGESTMNTQEDTDKVKTLLGRNTAIPLHINAKWRILTTYKHKVMHRHKHTN